MHDSASVDQILVYLKWLSKTCQAIFLQAEIPVREGFFPRIKEDNTPFRSGKFAFIEQLFRNGRRTSPLTKEQAYTLAQIASINRALPYPSKHLVCQQVRETCSMISKGIKLSDEAKRSHQGGVKQILHRLGEPDDFQVHISLGGSASEELPREEGGKAAWLVSNAKKYCDQGITPKMLSELSGTYDHLGFEVLNPATMLQAAKLMDDPENLLDLTVKDVLYLDPGEASIYFDGLDFLNKDRLPKDLTKILLLESSRQVLRFGHFNKPVVNNDLGLPLFKERYDDLKFIPTVTSIPVTAALSIESAMKSRLVTAAPSGYTEIGQTINNFMRTYLSKDAFLRIGFDEADKLWETLKAYEREFYKPPPQ